MKKSTTQKWLESQLAYTLHKPARRRFKRNRVFFNGKDEQWQANLEDSQALKRDNDGYRFLLTVIDVLSKYAWLVPLKDKTGKSLVDAFDKIFKIDGRVPECLQTDAGKEFLNKEFQQVLASKDAPFCHLQRNLSTREHCSFKLWSKETLSKVSSLKEQVLNRYVYADIVKPYPVSDTQLATFSGSIPQRTRRVGSSQRTLGHLSTLDCHDRISIP